METSVHLNGNQPKPLQYGDASNGDFSNRLGDYTTHLHPFAMRLTRNTQEANDLVQDTLLKALINSDKYLINDNLKGWLLTIMRNIFLNKRKRDQRSISTDPEKFKYNGFQKLTVDNAGPSSLNFSEIIIALRNIEQKGQRVLVLYAMGYRYQEISDRLKIPLGTVKVKIHKARKSLREKLKGKLVAHF